jgi:hypothetical protein
MDDMCQKSINTCYESLHTTKNQLSLAHVASITKSQPNLIRLG